MINAYNVVDSILFSESLATIAERLRAARKDYFEPNDRIIIVQDQVDSYPYIDAAGTKLIELQKLINSVDISNVFVLLVTSNPDIEKEIDFITKYYSTDSNPIGFLLQEGEYKKEVIKHKNTACRKLWKHLYVGPDRNVNPCCLANHRFPLGNIAHASVDGIIHGTRADQIRDWMIDGYRSIACSTCYSKEDQDIASARQPCDPALQEVSINSIDIRINNICNFKCRMCSEYFSSAIQQETIELYGRHAILGHEHIELTKTSSVEKQSYFRQLLPYITKNLKDIYFAGGEPLIAPEHYQILDQLIAINHTGLKIKYNTNLSRLSYKDQDVIDYWNQFDDVTVGASIDASGAVAEYVRHGTVWSDIEKNIFIIKNRAPNVNLQITSTVSFLTIENLIELQTRWIKDGLFQAHELKLNVLTEPGYLSPAVLPRHHKERLRYRIQSHIDWIGKIDLAFQWQTVLKFMTDNDYTHNLDDFRRRTLVLDKHRGESFLDIFPEFKDLYV